MTEAEIIANLDGDIAVLAKWLREAEERCNKYVEQNMRQAKRLADLEKAARDVIGYEVSKCSCDSCSAKRRLAEVLDGK